MTKPLVSVILPVHSAQEFLNITVDSVLLQSYVNFELLIIDCASDDQTKYIVNRYRDPRIKYSAIKSSQLKDGIATGIKLARGKYIALMGQTDISLPKRLEKEVEYLERHSEAELVGTNYSVIDENSRIIKAQNRRQEKSLLNWLLSHPFAVGTLMARAKIYNTEAKIYPEWWRVADRHPIAILPGNLYRLRQEAGKKLTGKDSIDDDYELWLRAAGDYPKAVKYPSEPIKSLLASKARPIEMLDHVEHLLKSANQIWAKTELSPTQQQLLEAQINYLAKQWADIKDRLEAPPTISVVMSIYNGQKFLKAAIQSILDQTFVDFEFIIIDDGSRDSTVRIVNSFNDPRIRLISQANHGLIYSLNKGIDFARASLIARQDADDISLPQRLEKELSALLSLPKAGVVGGFWQYINSLNQRSIIMVTPTKDVDLRRSLYVENPFAHGATLIRKSALKASGGYGQKFVYVEDYDLWRRIGENWQFYQVPEVLYLYRISEGSISSSNSAIQADISSRIRRDQWQKPFLAKSLRSIINDGHYYKKLNSPLARQTYQKYLDQQHSITLKLFHRGAFKTGLINLLAVALLNPKYVKSLLKPAAGGFLRRLGLMELRDDIY